MNDYDIKYYYEGETKWEEYVDYRLRYAGSVVQFNYSPDESVEIWRDLGGYHEHE